MTDPLADMLARIRNAIGARQHEIALPHSKAKEAVAKLLLQNRYLEAVSVEDATVGKTLKIVINQPLSNTRINEIVRISKPGRRHYASVDKIPTVKSGRGLVIISTSHGMMTGTEARKKRLGGELICKIY